MIQEEPDTFLLAASVAHRQVLHEAAEASRHRNLLVGNAIGVAIMSGAFVSEELLNGAATWGTRLISAACIVRGVIKGVEAATLGNKAKQIADQVSAYAVANDTLPADF